MAGTNDLGGRKKSNGNDKKPEEVAQELVNGAKKLLSFKSVRKVFICEVSPRLGNAETDEKIQPLNHCIVTCFLMLRELILLMLLGVSRD